MKVLVCCLMLGLLPASGEQLEQSIAPVVLYTQFQTDPPPAVQQALQKEVEGIMASADLRFEWRPLSSANGRDVATELVVVSFKGSCDPGVAIASNPNPGALGWTHMSDGVILPFSDVDCGRIRSFIQKSIRKQDPLDREVILGRAIGRVLAHELYHVLANTEQHGTCGVGRAVYSVQELLSSDFQFEHRNSLALRRSKVRAALMSAGGAE